MMLLSRIPEAMNESWGYLNYYQNVDLGIICRQTKLEQSRFVNVRIHVILKLLDAVS